ncbi:MAG: hypothetical protein H6605_08600 [Flavobacteriales bacterium]|nr:hypothetical protein [Flavobacteriales bacterium]
MRFRLLLFILLLFSFRSYSQTLQIDSVKNRSLCNGESMEVYFQTNNYTDTANSFVFLLSDGTGNFSNADTLKIFKDTSLSYFKIDLPTNLSFDSIYKIKLVSTAPANTSNLDSLRIYRIPVAYILGGGAFCQSTDSTEVLYIGDSGHAPYTFLYSRPGLPDTTVVSAKDTAILKVPKNVPGTYVYKLKTITDSSPSMCSGISNDSIIIEIRQLPTGSISVSGQDTVCINSASPILNLHADSGTAPFTFYYTINNESTQSITSSDKDTTILVPTNSAGTFVYKLIKVEESGISCSRNLNDSIILTIKPKPYATISGVTNICQNAPSPQIILTGFNGTPPYKFKYSVSFNSSPSQTFDKISNGDTAIILAPTSISGLFTFQLLNVSDSSPACDSSLTNSSIFTILFVFPKPSAIVTATNSNVCKNDSDVIIRFTGSGATPPYTFTYNVDNGPDQQIVSDTLGNAYDTLSTATAGTFYYHLVSVKENSILKCSNTQADTVSIAINPLPTAYLSGSDTLCYSGNPSEILFIGDSGTAPYTFTFSINGNDSVIVSPNNSDTAILSFSDTGLYVVVLKSVHDSSSTLCAKTLSDTALLLIKPLPKASMTVSDSTVCQGDPSVVVHFSGSGATPPYTFTFNVDNGPDQQIVSDTLGNAYDTLSTATAGTFYYHLVSVKDSSSSACSNTQVDTLSIAINPLPTAYLSGSDTLCYSGNPSEILFIGDSGTAPYTFTFSINGNDSVIVSPNNSDTAILSFSDTGLYVVVLKSVHDSSSTLCAKTLSDTALLLIAFTAKGFHDRI